uniref:MINDY deubiquitinase domain-containing protein n=2 Tax=Setaria italica TaxID=4555 RepID=K3ZHP1_SETIT
MKSESKGKTDRLSLLQSIWNNQFTSYGFAHLCNDVPEGVLCLLYRDERINVLYKHKGMLHVLVTAQDVLEKYPDALWRKLEQVDKNGDLLTSSFGPINVTWLENQQNLIEDERKAVKQKETCSLKNAKKHGRGKDKMNTVTQDESGGANKDLGDEAEANIAEDRGPASPKDGVLGANIAEDREPASAKDGVLVPSQDNMLRDGFMKFLKEYLLDGKPYFRDQVEFMHFKGISHLIICYGWIKTYDKELAVSICSNYFRAAEDLKLCFCDYFHSIMQENSVDTDIVELSTKIKLTICCLPLHKRFMSFEEFAAENCMYIVYELEGRFVNSTSYVGRLMALGYLHCILKTHKSGYSWYGEFGKSHMSVKIVKGVMIFKIKTLATMVKLNRDNGIADFDKYKEILFPLFKRHDVEGYPVYFDEFVKDFLAMPDPIESPVEFEKFQKYMGAHLFAKAPLVRSGLVTNTYQVCESLVFTRPPPGGWPVYAPLDFHDEDLPQWDREQLGAAMSEVYTYRNTSYDKTITQNRYDRHTYWYALMLGRHGVQHLHWYTKKGNVQTIKDFVIADLIVAHDLKGLLANVIYKIMKITNFDGPFSSVWRTFVASETFGDSAVEAGETEGTFEEPAWDAAVEAGETEAPGPATAAIPGDQELTMSMAPPSS